jgi:hypothetical protein
MRPFVFERADSPAAAVLAAAGQAQGEEEAQFLARSVIVSLTRRSSIGSPPSLMARETDVANDPIACEEALAQRCSA